MWMIMKKAQVEGQTVLEVMQRQSAVLNGEEIVYDQPSEPTESSTHSISLSTIGVSIDAPASWEVTPGDGADIIVENGDQIAAVMSQSEYDCETTISGVGG